MLWLETRSGIPSGASRRSTSERGEHVLIIGIDPHEGQHAATVIGGNEQLVGECQSRFRWYRLRFVSDFYCEQVLNGRRAVDVVYEDEHTLAFHHTRPFFEDAHIVVVPKVHVSSLLDPAAEAFLPGLLAVVRLVAAQVLSEHGAVRVLTNLGEYQDSKHLHWHVYSGEDISEPTERPPGPGSRRVSPSA